MAFANKNRLGSGLRLANPNPNSNPDSNPNPNPNPNLTLNSEGFWKMAPAHLGGGMIRIVNNTAVAQQALTRTSTLTRTLTLTQILPLTVNPTLTLTLTLALALAQPSHCPYNHRNVSARGSPSTAPLRPSYWFPR